MATAAIVLGPQSIEEGISEASVQAPIGQFPATFRYTGNGESSLRTGWTGNAFFDINKFGVGMTAQIDGTGIKSGDSSLATIVDTFASPGALRTYSGLFNDPKAAAFSYEKLLRKDAIAIAKEEEFSENTARLGLELFGAWQFWRLRRRRKPNEVPELTKVAAHLTASTQRFASNTLVGGTVGFTTNALLATETTMQKSSEWWAGKANKRQKLAAVLAGLITATAVSGVVAHDNLKTYGKEAPVAEAHYTINSLSDTPYSDTYVDSPILQRLADDSLDLAQRFKTRAKEASDAYLTTATEQLEAQQMLMAEPGEDEIAFMMQSDMHSNEVMIEMQKRYIALYNERYAQSDDEPAIALVFSAGDNTNGTGSEEKYIKANANSTDGAPFVTVVGNHDMPPTIEQMKDNGMEIVDGEVKEVAGITILGMSDPRRTQFLGPTTTEGDVTEQQVGEAARAIADENKPVLVGLHEPDAAAAFAGVSDPHIFNDNSHSYTVWREDGIPDVPASMVTHGHEHDVTPFNVAFNSDGTWTPLVEQASAGGALENPTLGNFSLFNEPPKKLASTMTVFVNKTSKLITGIQVCLYYPDGTVDLQPRINIGSEDGQPFPLTDSTVARKLQNAR
jgi:Icc-related predicted phosphoesterase